jgi:hypothetical protein
MGPKYQAQFLLDEILLRLGVAAPAASAAEPAPRPVRWRDRVDDALGRAWRLLPEPVREGLRPVHGGLRRWIDGPSLSPRSPIDPAASQCFRVSNNFAHGGIRINLAGREPQGRVQRGAECDALCEQVRDDLMQIVNLDNGKPIVDRVLRIADIYKGPYVDDLPDLVVEWSNYAPVYRIGSPKIGEVRGEYRYCRTGEHHPGGIFIGAGGAIPHGRLDREVSILVFAPTLSALLGVDLPDVDGQVIGELAIPIPD